MSDIVIKHFEGKEVRFHQEGEKLLLSLKEIGVVLGYKNPTESASKVYQSHKDEFDNDCTEIAVSAIPGESRQIRERLFTLDGLILLCMFSDQPVAKKVRRWLRKIGREVAVTGSYNAPVLTQILNQMNETLLIQGKMVQNLAAEVSDMREWRATAFIPAPPDNSSWPTPTQRIRVLIPKDGIPKHFNLGASFDGFVSMRHARIRGGLLPQRDRRMICKMPEYVIQPCPENDQFLRESFHEHVLAGGVRQQRLKLIPMRLKSEQAHLTPSL